MRRITPTPPPAAAPAAAPALELGDIRAPETRPAVRLSAEETPLGDGPFYAARTRLARGAERGPYIGAGLGAGADGDDAAGALLGGVAAPFLDEAEIFGEMQQVQRANGEEERRFWLGLRSGF